MSLSLPSSSTHSYAIEVGVLDMPEDYIQKSTVVIGEMLQWKGSIAMETSSLPDISIQS